MEGIRRSVLDSGLRVVTEALPELRSVTIGAWVGTGSRDETDVQSGASHFLEHLLFKGTPDRSAREIAEAVESVGGEMNAFTGQEETVFYVRVPDAHLDARDRDPERRVVAPGVPARRGRLGTPGDPRRDRDARRHARRSRARRLRGRACSPGTRSAVRCSAPTRASRRCRATTSLRTTPRTTGPATS